MAKRKQHESVGVDEEVRELLTGDEEEAEETNPFMLPEARKHKDPPVTTESKETTESEKLDTDSEYARNNLYELIEHGMSAIQDISLLAREHMHPRTYEVLATLLKNAAENNLTLIELANKKKSAKNKEETPATGTNNQTTQNIDQAIFVGSSADLLKLLKQGKKPSAAPSDDDERF